MTPRYSTLPTPGLAIKQKAHTCAGQESSAATGVSFSAPAAVPAAGPAMACCPGRAVIHERLCE